LALVAEDGITDDGIIEHGIIKHTLSFGSSYETSVKVVKDAANKGRICILNMEMEVCAAFPFLGLPVFPSRKPNPSDANEIRDIT
jgi:guanylate kinase